MNSRGMRVLASALLGGLAVSLTAAGTALAGGSPENILLIIDPTNPVSLRVGNHYKAARNIPDANVLYLRSAASDYTQFKSVQQRAFLDTLAQRGIGPVIDYVVLAPSDTFFVAAPAGLVDDDCSPVRRFSITTAYSLAQSSATITPMTDSLLTNQFASVSSAATFFDASTGYLNGVATTSPAARRYHIAALLGYTGERGNTAADLIAMIDRSVAVDGTRPAGSFYFMNNQADPARNVRQPGYAGAVSQITSAGGAAVQLNGELPPGRTNVRGIMTGMAAFFFPSSGSTILPGAFCDNLTSFAATFDEGSQTKVSSWIAAGASGSAGEVEEPCNFTQKFPQPFFHVWYFRGMSLGEAYFRSVASVPFQGLLYGDPMTRPWAALPTVSLAGLPEGSASGVLTLTPSATVAPGGGAAILAIDLLVDGVVRSTISAPVAGRSFTLNTTTLDDGWHDVRVVARDSSAARHQGRFAGSLVTANAGRSAELRVSPASGDLGTSFQFAMEGRGGVVTEHRLLQNGRVIAAAPGGSGGGGGGGASGIVTLPGITLGADTSSMTVEVSFADGRIARSRPVNVSIAPSGAPAAATPTAFSYTRRLPTTGQAYVIDLPAALTEGPGSASFFLMTAPTRATILDNSSTAGVRLIAPGAGASGSDSLRFVVQTPSGTSSIATVTLLYGPPTICPWDFNGDGGLDPDDLSDFITGFFASPPAAGTDVNGDGITDPDDLSDFITGYFIGC